jgi:hypothetical protein
MADAIEALGNPRALTISQLANATPSASFRDFLTDRRNARQIPYRLEAAGYVAVRNECAQDGLWKVSGRRQVVYASKALAVRNRIALFSLRARFLQFVSRKWEKASRLALLWQIYSRRRSRQIHFRQCGHRRGGGQAMSSRIACRTCQSALNVDPLSAPNLDPCAASRERVRP